MTAQLQHIVNDIAASTALTEPAFEIDFHSFYSEMEKLPYRVLDKIIGVKPALFSFPDDALRRQHQRGDICTSTNAAFPFIRA